MTSVRISAVIITLNEEKNIERCLKSLQAVSDEIVVVDSFSKDSTQALAEALGARFIQNNFIGHIEQKNFTMNTAQHNIILSLDADEELSEALTNAILEVKNNWQADAYAMNRLNNYCGKFIHHGHWYPDRKIRLWDRRKGLWGGENPHDVVTMNSSSIIKRLKGDLLHYTYATPYDHILQMNKFSDIAAKEAFKKGKKASIIKDIIFNPPFTFIKSYIVRLGFLDGYAGFLVAIHSAYYRFLKYTKLKHLSDSKK